MPNQFTAKIRDWDEILIKERLASPDISYNEFARLIKKKYDKLNKYNFRHIGMHLAKLEKEDERLIKVMKERVIIPELQGTDIEKKVDLVKEGIKKKIRRPTTIIELANLFDVSPKRVEQILDELKKENYNIHLKEDKAEMITSVGIGGKHKIDLTLFENKTYKIGFLTDDHLCNKAERLDVLNAIFDRYHEEGITEVYNGGNWIDGEASFNTLDIHIFGMDNQIKYFIENYPQRKGIRINFIAGDDHEGWYQQKVGIIIGKHLEQTAKEMGRNDLNYCGYMEADFELKASKGSAILRVVHAGGGTAYALSYQPQKLIESLTGGDKPHILLIGHYHKAEVLPSYRNVRSVQGGCGCDQTRYMRKKRIEAHVGGWIIEFQQAKDGSINRFKTEWLGFFDQEFYKAKKYYV